MKLSPVQLYSSAVLFPDDALNGKTSQALALGQLRLTDICLLFILKVLFNFCFRLHWTNNKPRKIDEILLCKLTVSIVLLLASKNFAERAVVIYNELRKQFGGKLYYYNAIWALWLTGLGYFGTIDI